VREKTVIEFKDSLGPWFGKTMKLIESKIEEALSENDIDLSKMQFIILKNIEEYEGICQNELAFFAKRDKSSLTRMINTLINKGYITKCSSEEDKRKNHIHLTTKGKEIIKIGTPHFHAMALTIEKNLTQEEIEFTKNILKKIQINVNGSVLGSII
jgi:DNA-binding MarR family transcriptional regulator